jgi:uncharacterized protein (DUF2252 family)
LEIDQLTRDEAVSAARYLAAVVGKAHARQMTNGMRREWIAELHRNRTKNLDEEQLRFFKARTIFSTIVGQYATYWLR